MPDHTAVFDPRDARDEVVDLLAERVKALRERALTFAAEAYELAHLEQSIADTAAFFAADAEGRSSTGSDRRYEALCTRSGLWDLQSILHAAAHWISHGDIVDSEFTTPEELHRLDAAGR